MFILDSLLQIRLNTLNSVAHLNTEALNFVPKGCRNNIIWHIGHMAATQQILCYLKSGYAPILPEAFIEKYRKGTDPLNWEHPVSMDEIKDILIQTAKDFKTDYLNGKLTKYESYPTSSGIVLNTIEDALVYNYGHENLHYGNVLTMLKML